MKRLILLLIIVCSISCQKSEVKLEVLNREIYFTPVDMFKYRDEQERRKAENIITYRLTNTTDKKLLFVFDQLRPEPSFPITHAPLYHYGFMGFYIKDENDSIKQYKVSLPYWVGIGNLANCKLHEFKKMQQIYAKLGVKPNDIINADNFVRNSIVIYPGEIRTFKTIVTLALIQEIEGNTETPPLYYDLNEKDIFQLFYFCKAKDLKESLPQYLKDDLDQNNIDIFDGKLNAIPVKLKKR